MTAHRLAIIVLGMHRSGTSAFAGALGMLGMTLPERIMPPTADNAKGYFEPDAIVAIHDRLLNTIHSNWSGFEALPRDWFRSEEAARFAGEIAEAVRHDYGESARFVVKDPRLCRLMPLWRKVLASVDAEARYVIPIRSPAEVARSLEKRDGLALTHGYLLWLRHLLEAERETRGERRVFRHYHELLADPAGVAASLAGQLIDNWSDDDADGKQNVQALIDSDMRHQVSGPGELPESRALQRWLKETCEALDVLTRDPHDKTAEGRLDPVYAQFDEVVGLFAPLLAMQGSAVVDADNGIVAQSIAERESRIVALDKELSLNRAISGERAADLHVLLTERINEVVSLQTELTAREAELAKLNRALADRATELDRQNEVERQLVAANEALTARVTLVEGRATELEGALAARDGHIANLNQAIEHQAWRVSELAKQADDIFRSTGWRLLGPLHWYGRKRQLFQQFCRDLRAYAAASQSVALPLEPELGSAAPPSSRPAPNGAHYRCSLVIPTKNGGELFKRAVAMLKAQTCWPDVEFIVVDSGSTDDTVAVAKAAGAKVHTIPPREFNHGSTRDYGISLASCDHIVLMVQDAIPQNPSMIEHLLAALDEDDVAGSYARQIPQPTADVITKRSLNGWLTGKLERKVKSIDSLEWYASLPPIEKYFFCNFDNVCSAINKRVWEQDHFGRINFGEDVDWAERVLKRGFKIVYEPAAAVFHSHDRSLLYDYKRTYVCHRFLYRKFGLHLVPSMKGIWRAWLMASIGDMLFVAHAESRMLKKIRTILTVPMVNLVGVLGQYRGAQDEMNGKDRKVRGV